MLDVRRMRILQEVAREGSIAGAARTLSFTPSAVSQQVSTLEREVGVRLVERGACSLRLTEAGEALVRRTEAIVVALAEAELEVKRAAGLAGGTLRVASFGSASATFVAAALARYRSRWPSIEATLDDVDPREGERRLRRGEADVALGWEYDHLPLGHGEGLARVPLADDPVRVLLPAAHAAAREGEVPLRALADDAWVTSTPGSSCNAFTARACAAAGFEPRVAAQTDDHLTLQRLVASGAGVAFETELSLARLEPGLVARPTDPPLLRRIFALHRAGAERVPRIAALLELLEGHAGAAGAPLLAAV
jgi:molybdate transport repressor ModE-like protein